MILKIMAGVPMPDECANAPCVVIADVRRVILEHDPDIRQAYIHVWSAGRDDAEMQVLRGNAYLMTDQGKTVQTFSPLFPEEMLPLEQRSPEVGRQTST